MQDSSDSQPIGEIVSPPPSVQINAPQLTGSVQAPVMGQPTMQQNVVDIQMPKFKHPTRTISSIVTALAIFIFLISFFNFSSTTGYGAFTHLEFGFQSCCFLFNIAFILEIVYYSKLIEYNKTHGVDNTWPVLNQLLVLAFAGIGLLIFVTNFV